MEKWFKKIRKCLGKIYIDNYSSKYSSKKTTKKGSLFCFEFTMKTRSSKYGNLHPHFAVMLNEKIPNIATVRIITAAGMSGADEEEFMEFLNHINADPDSGFGMYLTDDEDRLCIQTQLVRELTDVSTGNLKKMLLMLAEVSIPQRLTEGIEVMAGYNEDDYNLSKKAFYEDPSHYAEDD